MRKELIGLVLGSLIGVGSLVWAGTALADDACTAKCDAQSDKCNQAAGKDQSKARDCDTAYDACLQACTK